MVVRSAPKSRETLNSQRHKHKRTCALGAACYARAMRMLFLEPECRSDLQWIVAKFARIRLGVFAFLFMFTCLTQIARAEVSVPVPEGWDADSEANKEARNRGADLALLLDADMIQLASTPTSDEFIERMLVLKRGRSVPTEILSDVGEAKVYLTSIIKLIYEQEPRDPISAVEIIPVGNGAPIVAGTWATDDGLATRLVVVPKGLSEVLIIMEARRKELFFFDDVFDFVTSNLTGTEVPIPPFSTTRWRISITLLLVLAGLASFFGVLFTADQTGAYEKSGKLGGSIMLGVSLLATGIVFVALRNDHASLRAAGVSSDRLAIEAAITGLAIATGSLISGLLLRKDSNIVASAPTHGIYSASSSQTSGVRPMISSTFTGTSDDLDSSDSNPTMSAESGAASPTGTAGDALPVVTPSVPVAPRAATPPTRASTSPTAARGDDTSTTPRSSSSSSSSVRPVRTRSSSETPRSLPKLNLPTKPKPRSDS